MGNKNFNLSILRGYLGEDDDMYISTRNVLHFIRNPSNYPDYDSDLFEMDTMLVLSHQSKEHRERSLKQQVLLPEEELNRPALFLADAVGSDENESDDLKLYAGKANYHEVCLIHTNLMHILLKDDN